ncbi:MAG: argininosuccinate lyase [Gemmatimonadetes bacterium]|nr:argininosuccinate lyase [Gemmatimonadota bacterium]MBI3504610.1 argininosuccinate lyase [Pseudomonadota bacterium]
MSSSDDSKSHKLWGGRFSDGPHPSLEAANRSIGVDFRLWPFDIRLSKAWALALVEAGVMSRDDADRIRSGLDRVAERFAAGAAPSATDEDIHTMIDRLLHEEAGEPASRLHTGRSRNDQVATATRLWTIDAIARLDARIVDLQRAMVVQAEALEADLMPAYTHLQRAQPVSAAHWMLAHFWPLQRDRTRLTAARAGAAVLPLGSGAIAGSAFPVPRPLLQRELGFDSLSPNSIDAVGDRDFVAELLFTLALTGAHLSRLAEDLILFGSSEFGFVRFGDAFSTGSSMMPQKRNPDALELARGSGARVLGDLVALLATVKGLPSGYNKDLQEDKRSLFDAVDTMELLLPAIAGSVETLTFDRARMRSAVTSTMMATDLADYLVRKRVTFREAHAAVGRLVREAEEKGIELTDLPVASFNAAHPAFGDDVRLELDPVHTVRHRELEGGTGPHAVRSQLERARSIIR